tara:strand:+ start:199 stop:570 length:372 start_codon:yes stop_codon:yes gene_type:complete
MAHFAKLGKGNIVEQVVVLNNNIVTDANGQEQEQLGVDFLNNMYGTNDVWKQASYNGSFRKNFAGLGFKYDQGRDAFIEPKPFNSWNLNETTCRWEAPVAKPDDGQYYRWNEENQQWELVVNE